MEVRGRDKWRFRWRDRRRVMQKEWHLEIKGIPHYYLSTEFWFLEFRKCIYFEFREIVRFIPAIPTEERSNGKNPDGIPCRWNYVDTLFICCEILKRGRRSSVAYIFSNFWIERTTCKISVYFRWVKQQFEPEFLNILKCNLAESAGAGFQFNCYDIFND